MPSIRCLTLRWSARRREARREIQSRGRGEREGEIEDPERSQRIFKGLDDPFQINSGIISGAGSSSRPHEREGGRNGERERESERAREREREPCQNAILLPISINWEGSEERVGV